MAWGGYYRIQYHLQQKLIRLVSRNTFCKAQDSEISGTVQCLARSQSSLTSYCTMYGNITAQRNLSHSPSRLKLFNSSLLSTYCNSITTGSQSFAFQTLLANLQHSIIHYMYTQLHKQLSTELAMETKTTNVLQQWYHSFHTAVT